MDKKLEPQAENIRNWYLAATARQREDGRVWYALAYRECERIASAYDVSVATVAGVAAALSPQNRWEKNIENAERFVRTGGDCKVSTFNRQKAKAQRILDGEDVLDVLKGPKVRNFYLNIMLNTGFVTVDRHAARIAMSSPEDREPLPAKTGLGWAKGKRYGRVADLYRQVAEEVRVAPSTLQAITWTAFREQYVGGQPKKQDAIKEGV